MKCARTPPRATSAVADQGLGQGPYGREVHPRRVRLKETNHRPSSCTGAVDNQEDRSQRRVVVEAQEQPRTEGRSRANLFARRDESARKANTELSQGGESRAQLSVHRFVREIESDPAVAGADSPCQNLLGG